MSDPQFSDGKFNRYFAAMIIAMIALTAILMVLASHNASEVSQELKAEADKERLASVVQEISPVGAVTVGSAAAPVVAAEPRSGEEVYKGACAACHSAGVAGAPRVGDVNGWTARIAKGIDTLYSSAINGIGGMPAKGGQSISEYKKAQLIAGLFCVCIKFIEVS